MLAIDERRPVGHDLFDGGPPAGEAGDTGWAGQHQRRDLAGEPLDRSPLPGPHADSKLDLRSIRIGGTAQRAVRGIGAHELGQDLLELEPQVLQPLAKNAVGGARLVVGLRPGIDQGPDRLVAVEVGDGDLEQRSPGAAPDPADPNPVAPRLLQLNGGEVGDAVGRDVA